MVLRWKAPVGTVGTADRGTAYNTQLRGGLANVGEECMVGLAAGTGIAWGNGPLKKCR